jgi:hypothetical protein
MLEDFKTDILSSLSFQLDTPQMKKKKEEKERALTIFCPKYRMKYPWKECLLDQIEVCGICSEDHATCNYPSLLGLKDIYQKAEESEQLCFVSQKRPLQPRPQGMIQDQSQYFNSYWTNPSMQYTSQPWGMPTQQWVAPPPPNQLWKQGW